MARALAVLALLLAACGGSDAPDGYGAGLRRDFVEACSTGADAEVCGCLYDRLADEVPFERFVELDEQLRADPSAVPDDVAELAVACAADAAG